MWVGKQLESDVAGGMGDEGSGKQWQAVASSGKEWEGVGIIVGNRHEQGSEERTRSGPDAEREQDSLQCFLQLPVRKEQTISYP